MAMFQYKMLDDSGEVRRGRAALPFDDLAVAIRYLERQGGTVLAITPLRGVHRLAYGLSVAFGRVSRKELAEMLNNLSMLLGAGVSILGALREMEEDADNQTLGKIVRFLRTDIEGGQTLSESMARQPAVFSPLVVNMCRIGEETGRLDAMLKKACGHLRNVEQIFGATRRGLLYPGLLSLVVLGACAFWFLYVVPGLVKLFQDMGLALPAVTRLVLEISELFQACFFEAFFAAALFGLALWYCRRKISRVRLASDALLLRIPVVRGVLEASSVARICEYFGILISAGIGILRTLEIVAESVGNEVYRLRLLRVREGILGGATLAGALRQARALHPFAVRMIAVGEQSGCIEEQTRYVAEVYRERLVALVDVLSKSLEPLLLICLGGVFALVIGGLLFPIYDLLGNLR